MSENSGTEGEAVGHYTEAEPLCCKDHDNYVPVVRRNCWKITPRRAVFGEPGEDGEDDDMQRGKDSCDQNYGNGTAQDEQDSTCGSDERQDEKNEDKDIKDEPSYIRKMRNATTKFGVLRTLSGISGGPDAVQAEVVQGSSDTVKVENAQGSNDTIKADNVQESNNALKAKNVQRSSDRFCEDCLMNYPCNGEKHGTVHQ